MSHYKFHSVPPEETGAETARRCDRLPTTKLKKSKAKAAGGAVLLGRIKTLECTQSDKGKPRPEQQPFIVEDEEKGFSALSRESSDAVKSCLSERYHTELFRLYMLESDQDDRVDLIHSKYLQLEAEREDTRRRIALAEAELKSMEDSDAVSIKIRREHIGNAKTAMFELEAEMEHLKASYEKKRVQLEHRVREWQEEVITLEMEIDQIEKKQRQEKEPEAAGPRALRWLDSDCFHVAAGLVTVLNLLAMLAEITHPGVSYGTVNVVFLAFFQVEFLLNLVYRHGSFFCGAVEVVWWNWLDFLIVLSGTLESEMHGMGGSYWASGLRTLRLFRLVRIMKIVKLIWKSDMSWADGHAFQTFMMLVISFNTLLMGFQEEWPDFVMWPCVDYALLIIYIFELLVRVKHNGCKFFHGGAACDLVWNWLDLLIVVGGVVDMCFVRSTHQGGADPGHASAHGNGGSLGQAVTILRMARLARVLRLVRLVRGVPPLYTLVVGIAKAMQGVGWVLVLTMSVLFICSLVGVKLVGRGWVIPSGISEVDVAEVKETFADIPVAFFNLFKAMNADLDAFEPLMRVVPVSKYILMAFVVVTNWAIFSILTAVVSDNMAKVTAEHEEELKEEKEAQLKAKRADKLEFLFTRLDVNGDGSLDINEFRRLLADEVHAEELARVTGLDVGDLEDLFELLSKKHDDEGVESITHQEFTTLLNRECNTVTVRSMMKIERALGAIQRRLEIAD